MTLLFKIKPGRNRQSKCQATVNIDEEPCPTIMAQGANGVGHGQYWLEDDGMDARTKTDKPPYRVPSMEEIAAVPWNGLTVASLFAGCGGSSLGYRMAGYRMAYANEFVPAAQDCYRANMREGTVLDGRDVRLVTPEEILEACGLAAGELDVLDGSPPCFAAGTLVLTRRGLAPIEDVRTGDMVVTHRGRWRRVSGANKRDGAIVRARGHGHPGIRTTAEHPFWVRRSSSPWDNARRNYRRQFGAPEWRAIGDCAPIKSRKITEHETWFWGMRRTYPRDIVPEICRSDARLADTTLSPELFWLVGLWLGDGWLRSGRAHVKPARGEVLICAAKDQTSEVRRRIEAAGLQFSEAEMRTTIRFTICHTGLAEWLEEDFGRGARGKTVPYWAFGMPEEWRRAMLDGYVFADGTRPRDGQFRTTSISWPLTLGMAMVARSLGIAAGIRAHLDERADHRIELRRVNVERASYAMTCFERPHSFVIEDEFCWGAVKEVEATGEVESVYNLHVEEDESYVADGLVVHNCQAFSTAGRRHRNWGQERKYEHGAHQKNEDLFLEFIRVLRGVRPRAFVAENVSGLVKGVAKGYFIEILRELKASGYRVEARVLDAQWLGVPQCRARVFFVGVREDLGLSPAFPSPLPYRYSVRDAIPWLGGERVQHDTSGQPRYSMGDVTDRPSPAVLTTPAAHHFRVEGPVGFNKHKGGSTDQPMQTVMAGRPVNVETKITGRVSGKHFQRREIDQDAPMPAILASGAAQQRHEVETRRVRAGDTVAENVAPSIAGFALEAEYAKLNPGQASGKYRSLIKADAGKPSPTITALGESFPPGGAAAVCHPTERRKFTIAELKRICSFPDSFVVTGTYGQSWERLGNAVPPLMLRSVAEVLRDAVLLPARAAAGRSSKATPGASAKGRGSSRAASKGAAASRARRNRPRGPAGRSGGK